MPKFVSWKSGGSAGYHFYCPGCERAHTVYTEGTGPKWSVTGVALNEPNVHPSVRNYDERGTICHVFIKAGRIQFLADCKHKLAGTTVELPHFPLLG